MTRPVSFDPAARLEVIEAAVWYDQQRRALGQEFPDAIERAVEHASRGRTPGVAITGVDEVLAVPVTRFPYAIVVLPTPTEIIVVAVMHERRRPAAAVVSTRPRARRQAPQRRAISRSRWAGSFTASVETGVRHQKSWSPPLVS